MTLPLDINGARLRLQSEEANQIFVPAGFAHGFITLMPGTVVNYKVDNYYSKDHERGFIWDDPDANINWGETIDNIVISEKDNVLPKLNDLENYF